MQLTVLNIASPFAPVSAHAAGPEGVLAKLDEALVRDGHDSVVVACEGSDVAGILVSMSPPAVPDNIGRRRVYEQYRLAIQRLLTKWRFDLVHMHGVDFYEYLPPAGVPVLATLHLPPEWYPRGVFELNRPQTYLQCISTDQWRACPACSYLLPESSSGVSVENYFSIYEQLANEMVGLEVWMAVREAAAMAV
jgi:hypothetical protein